MSNDRRDMKVISPSFHSSIGVMILPVLKYIRLKYTYLGLKQGKAYSLLCFVNYR